MRRLILLRHGRTAAVRASAFPVPGEPLDDVGRREALALAGWTRGGVVCSPLPRAVETAALLGHPDATRDEGLREADFGTWAGRSLAEVVAEDPGATASWMADVDAAPHGGESLRVFCSRVATWLDAQAAGSGGLLAVTHGGVVKAAVVHALGAPLEAFWRVDVGPLHATELHAHDGRWTVARVNARVAV